MNKPIFQNSVILAIAALLITRVNATPISGDNAVATAVSAPLNTQTEIATVAVTATVSSLLPDLPSAQKNLDSVTQLVSIESSKNNTARVCVRDVPFPDGPLVAATDTCAEVCALQTTLTCNETSTDGQWVDPGEPLPKRETGRFCFCGIATSGSQKVQALRNAR